MLFLMMTQVTVAWETTFMVEELVLAVSGYLDDFRSHNYQELKDTHQIWGKIGVALEIWGKLFFLYCC